MSKQHLLTSDLSSQIQDDGVTLQYNPYSWNKVGKCIPSINCLHAVMLLRWFDHRVNVGVNPDS